MAEPTLSTTTVPGLSGPNEAPEYDLNKLYSASDKEVWLVPSAILIGTYRFGIHDGVQGHQLIINVLKLYPAATRLKWRSSAYDHFVIGLEKIPKIDSVTGIELPGTMVFTFTCRHDPTRCKTLRLVPTTWYWRSIDAIDAVVLCQPTRQQVLSSIRKLISAPCLQCDVR
ncbi:hypothetical protein RhiJN_23726 [Ceratobasidium sp. AG-Ba]|nr:hypothetical protein RhiJN_23726 [Ceratobasidium sp. AG-Ba]